jgi:hypothetical protein
MGFTPTFLISEISAAQPRKSDMQIFNWENKFNIRERGLQNADLYFYTVTR